VKPHTRYRFGGWIRTENVQNQGGKGAMINIHGGEASEGISGTHDWKAVEVEFDSGSQSDVLLHCLMGGYGGGRGTAWYDGLYLNEANADNIDGVVDSVVKYFTNSGDPALRTSLASSLANRTDDFSKGIATALGVAPVEVKAMVRKNIHDPAVHERGLAVYSRTCIACHGPEGKGVPGAFPPLDGSSWVVGDATIPVRIVLLGLQGPIEVMGQKFENMMPPHIDLKDGEIADVLTYVRQSWSNDATPVGDALVRQTRTIHGSRGKPWTAPELK